MSDGVEPTWAPSLPRREWEIVGPVLLLVPMALLALSDTTIGARLGVAIAVAVAAAGVVCNHPRWPSARILGLVAAIAGAELLTATSVPTLTTEILAAACGILILHWVSRGAATPARRSRVARGLTLPAASVGIALATGLLLVPGQSVVGLTAALVVGAVAVVAYLLGQPPPPVGEEPEAS
jgi:hypothetical protein